jgi:hypothetical protein
MYGLWANIFDNPILVRELRRRMRGKALIYSIISYLFLMTLSTIIVMLAYSPSMLAEASTATLQDLRRTGESLFKWITAIQVLLVLIVAPTITAGMTTAEKERQTFDFLRVTTISRWMYVTGCFLSTAFYVGLALLCALPLLAITFLYGGVSLQDVLGMFLILLGGSCVLSAFGLFISSVVEKTRTAQGIVIFLVFGLLFGGLVLLQQYRSVFIGATTTGGATSGLYLAGIAVPNWLVLPAVLGFFTGVFLLLSARKLFEPEETRAFSHWQFALVFLLVLLPLGAIVSGNQFPTELPQAVFLNIGFLLLMSAVLTFSIGRMEVGDEIWHLKRLLPFLRPIDQTLPFLAAIGVLWWFLGTWALSPGSGNPLEWQASDAYLKSSLALFFLLVAVGRASTGLTGSSIRAFRITLSTMISIVFVAPIVLSALAWVVTPLASLVTQLSPLSPPYMLMLVVMGNSAAASVSAAASAIGLLYLVTGLGLLLAGEIARYRRWKHFDYHYDMPAR